MLNQWFVVTFCLDISLEMPFLVLPPWILLVLLLEQFSAQTYKYETKLVTLSEDVPS